MQHTEARPVAGVPGATFRMVGELPDHLAGARAVGPGMEASQDAVLFSVPRLARFLVRGGAAIEVEMAPRADAGAVNRLVETSGRALLIVQRGELALDGTALVSPQGEAVALCGISGTGKATIAAALCARGWKLLSAGIVRVSQDGAASAGPAALPLWQNSCQMLGIDTTGRTPIRQGIERFHVEMPPADAAQARLAHIVVLRASSEIALRDVSGADKPMRIRQHTAHLRALRAMGRDNAHSRLVAAVAPRIRMLLLDGAAHREIAVLCDCIGGAIQ